MVRQLEKAVVEAAFRNGFVKPPKPQSRSGKSVAVIGGGRPGWPPRPR